MINNFLNRKDPKRLLEKEKKKYLEIIDKGIKDQQKNTDKFINSKLTLEEYQRLQNKAKDDVTSSRLAFKKITDYEEEKKKEGKKKKTTGKKFNTPTNEEATGYAVIRQRINTSDLNSNFNIGSEGVEL